MVKNSPKSYESGRIKKKETKEYDPNRTYEHDVDIPYLHAVEIPQVVHDRKVMVVPQKIVEVQEKLVGEKPTHIHHFKIEKPEPAPAPAAFFEHTEEDKGMVWPWWWWIALLLLLLLCCLLPLCCLLCYYCCKKEKKPEPTPVKKPIAVKQKEERPMSKPDDDADLDQRK